MQQTEKYQFNLIESSDPFSPEALNDNAVKLEAALERHKAETTQALNSRMRVVAGSYTGTGEYGAAHPCSIKLDPALGSPIAILFVDSGQGDVYMFMEGVTMYYSSGVGYTYCPVTWTEQGVSWYSSEHEGHQMNVKDRVYPYIILF